MSVRINLGKWGSVFAVPSCVVDEHIKIAGESQLKVLLFLLKNSYKAYTYKEIGEALSIHESDVKDCVDFWIEREVIAEIDGILIPDKANDSETKKDEKKPQDTKKKNIHQRPLRPDIITSAQIINSDKKLQDLLTMVQNALSKPLSSGGTSVIVMLYDTCGLPAEVIIMLVNYCVSLGKSDMRTIERMGIKWADEEINTVQAVENRIAENKRSNENWNRVKYVFGLTSAGSPTPKQLEFADRWVGQWHFSDEMLRTAYELNVDSTGKMSLPYINKILKSWYDAGFITLEDIEKTDKAKKKTNSKKSSYDLDELMKIQ